MKKIFSRVISAVLTTAVMAGAVPSLPCFSIGASTEGVSLDELAADAALATYSAEFSIDFEVDGEVIPINGVLHPNELICLDAEYDEGNKLTGFTQVPLQFSGKDNYARERNPSKDGNVHFLPDHDYYLAPIGSTSDWQNNLIFESSEYDMPIVDVNASAGSCTTVASNEKVKIFKNTDNHFDYVNVLCTFERNCVSPYPREKFITREHHLKVVSDFPYVIKEPPKYMVYSKLNYGGENTIVGTVYDVKTGAEVKGVWSSPTSVNNVIKRNGNENGNGYPEQGDFINVCFTPNDNSTYKLYSYAEIEILYIDDWKPRIEYYTFYVSG